MMFVSSRSVPIVYSKYSTNILKNALKGHTIVYLPDTSNVNVWVNNEQRIFALHRIILINYSTAVHLQYTSCIHVTHLLTVITCNLELCLSSYLSRF